MFLPSEGTILVRLWIVKKERQAGILPESEDILGWGIFLFDRLEESADEQGSTSRKILR